MRFDMNLLPMYFPDVHPPFNEYLGEVLDEVQLAEDLGFECFWFTEHHFLLFGGAICNPAVFIAAAAARTSRIRLGTAISIVPLRHPLQTAEDYALADAVSSGRLDFGIGRGNVQLDYDAYQVDRSASRERFEEAMDVITGVWSQDKLTHHGTFWSFDEVGVYPRPTQRPHPTVWVAGSSLQSARWAGQHGYNIMQVAHIPPREAGQVNIAAWRSDLQKHGFDPATRHSQLMIRAWVDETSERARETIGPMLDRYHYLSSLGRSHAVRAAEPEAMRDLGAVVYGNPDECIQGILDEKQRFDFDTVAIGLNWGAVTHDQAMKAMRLWAKEVLPAFRD